jgi:hypothetical protein
MLNDYPAAFTALRDLPATPPDTQRQPIPASAPVVTHTPPADRTHIPAHQAWQWYRDPDTPVLITLLTTPAPQIATAVAPHRLVFEPPPSPAPSSDHFDALIADAAAQASAYLLTGTELSCTTADDAARLATALPSVAQQKIADRLGIAIADLKRLLPNPAGAPLNDTSPGAHALPQQQA